MPPPSWMRRSTASRIERTASPLTDFPANAPSRSTTCSHLNPVAAKLRACAAGSPLNTVALAISPRTRRTQAPPFRSMAGNRITRLAFVGRACVGRLVEALVVIMPRHDAPLDLGIARVRAPAAIAEALVEPDRGALRVAQIQVQHDQTQLARQHLDLGDNGVADAAAARPRRDKSGGDGAGESLRLVAARRPRELHRSGDDAVEPPGDELSLGDQQYALPVVLQHLPRRHLDPA